MNLQEMKKALFLLTALLCLMASCTDNPERSRLTMDKGINLLYNTSRFAEAEQQFTEAIKYDKNNYEAYYYRGCAKVNQERFDEAILDLQKALELKPDYADAEFTMGRIYFLKEDRDMACYYFKAAMQHGRPNVEDDIKGCP